MRLSNAFAALISIAVVLANSSDDTLYAPDNSELTVHAVAERRAMTSDLDRRHLVKRGGDKKVDRWSNDVHSGAPPSTASTSRSSASHRSSSSVAPSDSISQAGDKYRKSSSRAPSSSSSRHSGSSSRRSGTTVSGMTASSGTTAASGTTGKWDMGNQ
ncbi:hypothetical protein C8J56DRAFT_32962 [Mycena floridula]|nr:hypothetical protein C8J56DRAFT_32962 [Mycena floridula]